MMNVNGSGLGMAKGLDMRSSLAAFRATLGRGGEGQAPDEDDEDENEEQEEKQSAGGKRPVPPTGKRTSHVPAATAAGGAPKPKPPAAGTSTAAKPASSCSSSTPAPVSSKVQVKVVVKGVKSLPATSVAGISAQQAALAAAEEKTNHSSGAPAGRGGATASPAPASRAGGRIGMAAPSATSAPTGGGTGAGGASCLPASLPKSANILQFIRTDLLRQLPGNDVQKLFEFYHNCSATGGASSTAASPGGTGDKVLSKGDLQRLCGDILERLRRVLAEEVRKQSGNSASASDIAESVERELGFLVRGKNDDERRTNLLLLMLSKAGVKTPQLSKAAFMQCWGHVAQTLFTVRTDEALGCTIS
jgi:hypothetical protein